jgi:predicted kinase
VEIRTLPRVSRLIHLNGPPGIGKSTLARRYADAHPGVLNLDVDQVRTLIGGWRTDFGRAGTLVRPVATAMATAHLGGGHDVVFPQYLGRLDEIARFEAAAAEAGAGFREIVLTDDREEAVARFYRRGEEDDDPWHDEVRAIVEREGGPTHLGAMYDALVEVAAARPGCVTVSSAHGDVEGTYAKVLASLT